MKKFESLYCILETKIVYQLYINKKNKQVLWKVLNLSHRFILFNQIKLSIHTLIYMFMH